MTILREQMLTAVESGWSLRQVRLMYNLSQYRVEHMIGDEVQQHLSELDSDSSIYCVKDVMELFNVSRTTALKIMTKWSESGFKYAGRVFIRDKDVQKFLDTVKGKEFKKRMTSYCKDAAVVRDVPVVKSGIEPGEDYVDSRGIASRYDISPSTAAKFIKTSGLPIVKFGRKYFVAVKDLEALRKNTNRTWLRYPGMLKLAQKGMSYNEIGKVYNCSKYAVKHVLYSRDPRYQEKIKDLRRDEGYVTIPDLAEEFNVSLNSINSVVHGMPTGKFKTVSNNLLVHRASFDTFIETSAGRELMCEAGISAE